MTGQSQLGMGRFHFSQNKLIVPLGGLIDLLKWTNFKLILFLEILDKHREEGITEEEEQLNGKY